MHPILFLAASVLLSSIWGGVCAIMGGMAGVLFKNQVLIIIAPFLILSMISFVTGYGKGVLFETSYELGPLYLFRPACWDRNPAWYIAIWQVAFSGISALIFFWRGKKSELS